MSSAGVEADVGGGGAGGGGGSGAGSLAGGAAGPPVSLVPAVPLGVVLPAASGLGAAGFGAAGLGLKPW